MLFALARIKKRIPIGVAGAVVAVFYLYLLNAQSPLGKLSAVFIFLYLWGIFSLAAFAACDRLLSPRLADYPTSWRRLWLAGCLAAGLWLANNIPILFVKPLAVPFPPPVLQKIIFLSSAGFTVGLLLFTLSVLLAARQSAEQQPAKMRRFRWALYALPMLLAWLVYLLAYWPGMMSADSLNQWGQALSGHFNDHHPASHTFIIWLLVRIYPSPALVALTQILALALVSGYILGFFETQGVPKPFLWIASLVFALSPVNGTMVNTLWKDVFYSAALLGFTFLVYRVGISRGRWLENPWNAILLGLTGVLMSSFRHNGWPIVVGVLLLLLLLYWRFWSRIAIAAAVFAGSVFIIRGPIYRLVNVTTQGVYEKFIPSLFSLYSLAAEADPGSYAETVIQSIRPFSGNWSCDLTAPYQAVQQMDGSGQEENIFQKGINLISRSPNLMYYYYTCRRAFSWIVWDPYGFIDNTSHTRYLVDPNPYGIVPASKLPAVRERVSEFVYWSSLDNQISWLVWRPALYLYLFLFTIAVQVLKYRDWKLFIASAPLVLQAIGFTLLFTMLNFRLQYAVYLAALLFWPLLFAPRFVQPAQASAEAHPDQAG
ncbi:MAG: hypothetical protein B6D39_08440 [Anaerolineae bacterium UTCFX2]|jgi:hypothetical protein|nr:MAG: hypothetical protein B6D39_08440 [Anaerolineae bacterium UTCFX2]